MKKSPSVALALSILLAVLVAWIAVGYDVQHRIHQREVGAQPAGAAHAHL